jgi:dTDP-4-amino-4,6-dideoxygalactose transaminase
MIEYENLSLSNASFALEFKAAFASTLDKGWYILGSEVEKFELNFAKYIGVDHCIGVANGLDALTISMAALDLPSGSEVLVASNTYIATILAIVHAGLKPVLVEPDINTYNINPLILPEALTSSTRAICITHLYGKSCQMDKLIKFSDENNLYLIEDCAQSHGAKFKGKITGSFGIAGCFSFYPTKNLGALGDAGAITSNNKEYARRLRHIRNYGSEKKYINKYIGYNSRLDEIQAAFLNVKLNRLDDITNHKRMLANIYLKKLPKNLILPEISTDCYDVHHIFPIRVKHRDELKNFLYNRGVKTEIHYPLAPHHQEAFAGALGSNFPLADEIHSTELSLPISFSTTSDEVNYICNVITEFALSNSRGY